MSCPTPITPTTLPLTSLRVVAFSSTSTRLLSLVNSGNSKLAACTPISALSSTSFTDWRNSSVMYAPPGSAPSPRPCVKPVISAALLFHSFTSPLESMPKMGAFAVSMKLCSSFATRVISSLPCLRSVMSCPTPITPTACRSRLSRVVAFSSTSTRC